MRETSVALQVSAAFIESLGQGEPNFDQGLIAYITEKHPVLFLHMWGSRSPLYQLILANYPSDEQLQKLTAELPASLPLQVLREYRAKVIR